MRRKDERAVHHFDTTSTVVPDLMQNESTLDTADTFVDLIRIFAPERKILIPRNMLFLGLAAGSGIAEKSIAKDLNARHIVLVDRNPNVTLSSAEKRKIKVVKSGVFTFLRDYSGKKPYIASALGIDYVLDKKEKYTEFLHLLKNVMQPNGLVIISPLRRDSLVHVNGYEIFYQDNLSTILLFRGKEQ